MDRIYHTADIIKQIDGHVTKQIYPNTGHKIVEDEVKFVRGLLASIIHN